LPANLKILKNININEGQNLAATRTAWRYFVLIDNNFADNGAADNTASRMARKSAPSKSDMTRLRKVNDSL
jgi:hypothetical protein